MKILVVEDDPDYIAYVKRDISELNEHVEFTVAISRDAALEALAASYFDWIVLDLNIPTSDGMVDAEPVHGHAVFAAAVSIAAGTPIFVLTGSPAAPFVGKLTANVQQRDIWGGARLPTIEFLEKYNYGDQFIAQAKRYLDEFDRIFDIEIDRGAVRLTGQEHRLLRIFSRQVKAVRCAVAQLSGGLSGVKVFRLKLTDNRGVLIHDSVCKIGSRKDVFDENERFNSFVSRLDPQATPRKLGLLDFGAADLCGIFYGLAAGFESDAFSIALNNDEKSSALVSEISLLTGPWIRGVPQSTTSVGEIRENLVATDRFIAAMAGHSCEWAEAFEARKIQVVNGCCHGDMHGLNILVAQGCKPMLIDYGDVGPGPACLDPITLELSLFFHPSSPLKDSKWPSLEQAEEWGSLDIYLENSPVSVFVSACRNWAVDIAAGKREIAAVAYGYLARQMKYENVDKARVLALMRGAKKLFDTAT